MLGNRMKASSGMPPCPSLLHSRIWVLKLLAIAISVWLLSVYSSYAATSSKALAEDGSVFGQYLAGRFARSIGDTTSASLYYLQVLKQNPDNSDILTRAFLLMLADGRIEDATILAHKIARASQRSGLVSQVIAVEQIAQGDHAAAVDLLRKAPRSRIDSLIVPLVEAWSLAGLGNGDESFKILEFLKKRKGYTLFRTYHAALINDFLDRVEQAEAAYIETIKAQEGRSLRVVEAYGIFLERNGRYLDAVNLYRGFLKREPQNILIITALARANSKEPVAPLIAKASDGIAEAFYGIAGGLLQENARDSASIYARLALALKPDMPVALTLIGGIMEGDKRFESANEIYTRIEAGSPYGWNAQLRMASNLDEMDKFPAAVKLLRRLEKERPNRVDPLIELGDIFRSREKYKASAEAYDQAIRRLGKLQERHWTLLYSRAIAYERSNEWGKAEPDFLRALELKPEQPLVLNYLGYSWIDRGENLERARKMVEKAVELRPTDGYIVDSLGWALFRLGEFQGAVKQLERAVSLRPEDPIINDHLGDALWRVGRELEASFQWRRALALEPETDMVLKIKEKIQKGLAPITRWSASELPEGGNGN
jgi:tetratricopeptide (TPR) repeat protein